MKCLYDENIEIKSITAETVGRFSENVSDFLSKTDQVIPALVDTLKYLEDTDIPLQTALHALHSFLNNAEHSKIISMIGDLIDVLMPYLNYGKSKSGGVQKWTMEIISSVVIAADKEIEPFFEKLMEACDYIYKNSPDSLGPVKAQALETIGHLSKAVGKERFAPFLEYFTKESIAIIQKETDEYSIRDSAFGYLAAITKFMKEDMAEILPTIMEAAFHTINRDDISQPQMANPIQEFSRDSDSEPDQEQVYGKIEAFDEKASAIHCLGYLFQFIPKLMLPYLEDLSETLLKMVQYVEDNVRFECIAAINGIALGLNQLECGEDFEWEAGFADPTPIGEETQKFLSSVYFPTVAIVFDTEDENDVIER